MEWLKRLGAAIDYIEENLDREISYDEVARIACCSTYYFQRIFSYVSGVSLSEYIRCRKMTQAAFELQRTDNKVIDVAHKYGYSSPTSFNRAFQSVHGIAPIAAKSMGCTLCAYPSIQFSIKVLGGSAIVAFKQNGMVEGIISISSFVLSLIFFACFVMGDKEQFQNTLLKYEGLWERLTLFCMYIPFVYKSMSSLFF